MEFLSIVLGILGGISAVVTALFAYFGNLRLEKFKADLVETNAKVKASLDSSVHVSKAQFDKEFAIYQAIWVSLVSLRAKTLSLRYTANNDTKETEEARMQRRLKSFDEAISAFSNAMEENRPFYAHVVYESLCRIFDLCSTESFEYQYKDPDWRKDWGKTKENIQKIVSAIDACCELIRERIASLSVV